MKVVCNAVPADAWDAYVDGHVRARFSHYSAYGCIQRAYGYEPRNFAFLKDDRIVGVLPTFRVRSLFFGSKTVSQPFSEYGGMLIDGTLTDDDLADILEQLRRHLTDAGTPSLEMHGPGNLDPGRAGAHFQRRNEQACAVLALDRPVDELFNKVFDRRVRKAIKQARRAGLETCERSDPEIIETAFYPLYLDSMRRLGVPPHPLSYFLACAEAFGPRMKIFWAIKDGERIAGLLGFACGQRVAVTTIASNRATWHMRPNDLVHYEFIAWAATNGFRYFDFGSVRYPGQAQYKKKWGGVTEDDSYYFLSANGRPEEVATFNSSSGLMTAMAGLWSRFMPQAAARLVGPFIRRNLVR